MWTIWPSSGREGRNDETSREKAFSFDEGFVLPEGGLDLEAFNRKIIRLALEKHKGNRTKTAFYLGMSRRVLEGRLQKL